MVYLKAKSGRDVIIFKHLEQPQLNAFLAVAPKAYSALKQKCAIGLYFGGYNRCTFKYSDFILAEKGLISNQEDISKINRCELNGYNFTPKYVFDFQSNDRLVDVIGIFNHNAHKRHSDFVELGNRLTEKYNLKVKLITYGNLKTINKLNSILSLMNPKFPILYGIVNKGTFPFNHQFVINSLFQSKLLLHTSIHEGAARIVSEALSSGLAVVTRKDLKGGTNVRLEEYPGARTYENLDDAEEKIVELLREYPKNIDRQFAFSHFNEEESVKKLANFLFDNYQSVIDFSPYNDRVSALIPGHLNILDEKYTNASDDGVVFLSKFLNFCEDELGIEISKHEKRKAKIIDLKFFIKNKAKKIYKSNRKR